MSPTTAYAELGLNPGASDAEVKAAWRRLVSQWHPDRNPSAAAIQKMQRINQAIEQIRRSGVVHSHGETAEAPTANSNAEDSDAEGSPAQARTINRKIKLTLEEAAAGCIKTLRGRVVERCPPCAGAGFRVVGGACAECDGAGTVRPRGWFGWSGVPTDCTACGGDGVARHACETCQGTGKLPARAYRTRVRIPHGVRDGDLLAVDARGSNAGHVPVQLSLRIELLPHALFELDADGTVHCDVPVDGFEWIANRSVDVPTLTGMQRLQLSRDRLSYRLHGQGFPRERRGACGDQLVKVLPTFPDRMGADQQILLDQLVATSSGPSGSAKAERLRDWQRALQRLQKGRTRRGR